MSFSTLIKSLFSNGLFLSFVAGAFLSAIVTYNVQSNIYLKEKNGILKKSNESLNKKIEELSLKDEKIKELIKNTEELESKFDKKQNEIDKLKESFNDPVMIEVEKIVYKQCEIPKSGADLIQERIKKSNNLRSTNKGGK